VAAAAPINSTDALGPKLFAQACEGCHLRNGKGRQSPWQSLLGSHSAGDPSGKNLVQVLLQGTQIETRTGRVFMPHPSGVFSDTELAALANYVATQFAGQPGNVTPDQIRKQRESSAGSQ
jgi:mono/diheme cytochrome c family protein